MRRLLQATKALTLSLLTLFATDSRSMAQEFMAPLRGDGYAGEVEVPFNKSRLIQLDRAFGGVTVADGDIAEIVSLSGRSVYVFGKEFGSTTLTFNAPDGEVLAVADVDVVYDVDRLQEHFERVFPDENISIYPGTTGIVLDSEISTATRVADVLAVAERYAAAQELVLAQKSGRLSLTLRPLAMQRERDASTPTQNSLTNLAFESQRHNDADISVIIRRGALQERVLVVR